MIVRRSWVAWLTAAALLYTLTVSVSTASEPTPTVGLYFDEAGQSCNAEIDRFGPALRAHLLAFAAPGVEISGALVYLQVPAGLFVTNPQYPKNANASGSLTLPAGLDLQFQICPISTGAPIHLMSFDLEDRSIGEGQQLDLEFELKGGTISAEDTLTFKLPQLKICDPNDPNGWLGLLVALGNKATLNCSTGDCPCNETAIVRKTWTAVRRLYADD